MASGYRISDRSFRRFWLVVSPDARVCVENAAAIREIAAKNGVDRDSVTYISDKVIDWARVEDLVNTPGFFGERLVMIKDRNFDDLTDDDVFSLGKVLRGGDYGHLAVILGVKDSRKLETRRFRELVRIAEKYGVCHVVRNLDEKFLSEMIISRAKSLGADISPETAKKMIENVGSDAGTLMNETDKLCAACGYTEVTAETVENIGCKTVEASVFDIIDLICRRRPAQALKKLDDLFSLRTDEISILGAITSSFVDMYRCKTASEVGIGYRQVREDFDRKAKPYRYQKAAKNASAFSLKALEEILKLLLEADLNCKRTGADRPLIISSLVAQIMIKGFA